MWVFIFLYFVGLNICQAVKTGNSTQMYYVKLTIEENAIQNVTEILKPFVSDTSLNVDSLEITTVCENVSDGSKCHCKSNFTWSDKLCQSDQKCCGNETCTFASNSAHMCVSSKTVAIKGIIRLQDLKYHSCLGDKDSEEFKDCNGKLLQELKKVYSTLKGFDTLRITKYKAGSIIAHFEFIIAGEVKPQDLIEKSEHLNASLSATLNLETKGVVDLKMPKNPVCYNKKSTLICTLEEDLKTAPVWKLKNVVGETFEIFNGTESKVQSTTRDTTVTLENLSQRWAGNYTCAYHQMSDFYTITHQASAVLDISLLPSIEITTDPPFPRCTKSSDLLNIRVQCEIERSHENYIVSWNKKNVLGEIQPASPSEKNGKTEVHAVYTILKCNERTKIPQVNCTFTNRCNESRTASTDINIIYENDRFCEADGDWKETKAGFTAVLKCKDSAGKEQRLCNNGSTVGDWKPKISRCVNQRLDQVLQKAQTADTGLGSLNENAAKVFVLLDNVTAEPHNINSFSNINASVQVLSSMSQKQISINVSTRNDFLQSSSNLLDSSLNDSWILKTDEDNTSVAETFLNSVETLIEMSNLTNAPKKKNIEVDSFNCKQSSECKNTVFDVSVSLDSPDHGTVKTAGFKELGKYLSRNDTAYEPNSIVVSTTAEKQLDSVTININFKLLKPRNRDVIIKCVAWNNNTHDWSEDGCKWMGPSNEGLCICEHLSSFAILMSRYQLTIPWIEEVTYIGLSVSIVSLIISLGVELAVWNAVVKTDNLYLRHTAHVNISLCLLVADSFFIASSGPNISELWCKVSVLLKHFCYLSMFFWMFCLSSMLLHQSVFLFHKLSKKVYLKFSIAMGYVCPLLIVVVTFLTYKAGADGEYFSKDTCWLIYSGFMKGSIHTFVVPVAVIVLFNVFSMAVVIFKLLDHAAHTEKLNEYDRRAAVTVLRSVILLTPIFGVTWAFGFAVMLLDLTAGILVFVVNYVFTLLNSFQGFFILLTTCLGDKLTREALRNRLRKKAPASTTDSTTKLDSIRKK
ncbi:adhesion G-protein coupled receptor F3 isoform X2 [Plectropomus leopardus]|nr:adhesion G-protein coupled receptor F3 isoform X2 [Plectropomus leopardus]